MSTAARETPPAADVPVPGATGASRSVPASIAPAAVGHFELAWQDDFDVLDLGRWQLMTHSWDTNLAQFSTENARVSGGILSLLLTAEASDTVKPFRGVELRSRETLTYGKVEARARLARGSGVVSSLVTIYTPWPADNWNELDVEFLGKDSDRVQFNAMVYTGTLPAAPVQQSVAPTQFPELVTLPFDPSQEFHIFSVEWTPLDARFSVDGGVVRTWSTEIGRMTLPQNILLTIWASASADWAGAITADSVPARADYDWIRVYHWAQDETPAP